MYEEIIRNEALKAKILREHQFMGFDKKLLHIELLGNLAGELLGQLGRDPSSRFLELLKDGAALSGRDSGKKYGRSSVTLIKK